MAKARIPQQRTKRAREARAAKAIKAMIGSIESEGERFRADLERLIEEGRIDPIFRTRTMSKPVFEGWLRSQDRPDADGAFIAMCRAWYRDLQSEREQQDGSSRRLQERRQERPYIVEAKAYLDERMIRPTRVELDQAVARGEISRAAADMAHCYWDLRQRFKVLSAQEELESRARVDDLMGKLALLVRPGKAEAVRAIVERHFGRDAA